MSRIPIRIRLTAWFVVVLAIVLALLGTFVVERLEDQLVGEVDRSLTPTARSLADGYAREGLAVFVEDTREVVAIPGSQTLGAQIVRGDGPVVVWAGSPLLSRPLLPAGLGLNSTPYATSVRVDGSHLRLVAVGVKVDGRLAKLAVAQSLAGIDSTVRRTAILLLIGGAVSLLLAGFGAWHVAGRAMRPVNRMTMRAGAIDLEDLHQRVPVPPARDELNRLALTFNAMLDRLQSGVAARERLIADASHELRAPLAAMRAELDVSLRHDDLDAASRPVLESMREEVARMSRVVDNLLTLARIDGNQLDLLVAPTDLRDLADRAARTHAAAAQAAGVAIAVTGDPVTAGCDPDRIEQVVGNLLDNALRVAPQGSTIRIDVATTESAGTLSVTDAGPGVPEDLREHIFERFARLDPARGRSGGAGLGLAISREIATAHGGSLDLAATGPTGSTFTLTLPATTPDPALGVPQAPTPANA